MDRGTAKATSAEVPTILNEASPHAYFVAIMDPMPSVDAAAYFALSDRYDLLHGEHDGLISELYNANASLDEKEVLLTQADKRAQGVEREHQAALVLYRQKVAALGTEVMRRGAALSECRDWIARYTTGEDGGCLECEWLGDHAPGCSVPYLLGAE